MLGDMDNGPINIIVMCSHSMKYVPIGITVLGVYVIMFKFCNYNET